MPEKISKPIINCFIGYTQLAPQPCEVCPPTTPGNYSFGTNPGTGAYEIGIWLHLNDLGDLCGSVYDTYTFDDNLQNPNQVSPADVHSSNYAVLDALPGNYWHKTENASGTILLRKSITPAIFDGLGQFGPSGQYANRISLCRISNLFFDQYSLAGGARYHLDFGGIYKISRPGISGLAPMYFYFSPFKNIDWETNPDMNLNYDGAVNTGSFCQSGNQEYLGNPTIGNCFHSGFNATFNQTNGQDYFANSDLAFLNGYWSDNVITVGFSPSNQNNCAGNYLEFYADNIGSSCNLSFYNPGALVNTLACFNSTSSTEGDTYEVRRKFSTIYAPNDQFLVHVQARFVNGETINDCQLITINTSVTSIDRVAVMIRGNIEDYNPSLLSYQVDVYEM